MKEERVIHPAAAIFPLLEGREFEALVEDIRAYGVREPIVLAPDGRVLDGRNRLRACEVLGIRPPCRKWSGKGKLEAFVISMNLHRRHLSSDQRAGIAAKYLLPALEREAKERQAAAGPKEGPGRKPSGSGKNPPTATGKATEQAALATKTNAKYVREARDLGRAEPKALDQVIAGKVKIRDVVRRRKVEAIKAKAQREERELGRDRDLVTDLETVAGRCRAILQDPPTAYGDSECRGAAAGHYPTLTLDQLVEQFAAKIRALAHPEGCHLWTWTTWPMIRDAFTHKYLEAIGARWKGEIVWHKTTNDGAKSRIGTGRWLRPVTEILTFAVIGNAPLLDLKGTEGFIAAPRGKHSEKPEESWQRIERLSPGPRIELFARRPREGWMRWGNEA